MHACSRTLDQVDVVVDPWPHRARHRQRSRCRRTRTGPAAPSTAPATKWSPRSTAATRACSSSAEFDVIVDVGDAEELRDVGLLAGPEQHADAGRDRGDDRRGGLDVEEARLGGDVVIVPLAGVLLVAPGEPPRRAAARRCRPGSSRRSSGIVPASPRSSAHAAPAVPRRRLNHRRAADRRVPHQEPPVGRGHRVEDRAEIIEAVGVGDLGRWRLDAG